jgi:hypothetical protein
VSFANRVPYAPLISTSTWPVRGTSVLTAASTENVPLPCIGTHTCVAAALTTARRRSRTAAVTALKFESHEPQSRSIAIRVGSDVVRGPGVRRIGSRLKCLASVLRKWSRARRARHACVRVEQEARDDRVDDAHAVDDATISVAIAAAAPISPASSMLRIATDASCVSGAYRNTTAEIVTIALTNR